MKQDTAKENPNSSSVRVKAFRERLDSQFKRVEAYVTEDEKTRIQAVRTQENVTADVAVAGLLRLGLERYEELHAQAKVSTRVPAFVLGGAVAGAQCSALESALFAASAAAGSGTSFSGTLASRSAEARPAAASVTPATPSPADNPVARFFKNRKEIINE